jgi:hypothetical protein
MEYLFEAFAILFAVIFPLSFIVLFLRELIHNLGDSTIITPLEEASVFDEKI